MIRCVVVKDEAGFLAPSSTLTSDELAGLFNAEVKSTGLLDLFTWIHNQPTGSKKKLVGKIYLFSIVEYKRRFTVGGKQWILYGVPAVK